MALSTESNMTTTLLALLGALFVAGSAAAQIPADRRDALTDAVTGYVRLEREAQGLPAVSITIADRDGIVWSGGVGIADSAEESPAAGDTVHRVASISKLVVATAVQRLVAAGRLDLDKPVVDYLGDEFRPDNPHDTKITLRHLLSHHAGLLREPAVGHYFEPGDSLEALVRSMSGQPLVYAPGKVFKYSNAGASIAGRVVETVTGESFAAHAEAQVLAPLGMTSSSFRADSDVARRAAKGFMWTLDGRRFAAPTFELGMLPAANLYSTTDDLARFARSWFVGDARREPHVVDAAAQARMFEPPFERAGFIGQGFFLGQLDGDRRVGHGGAMYGFASEVAALPERGLAVAVAATLDFANGAVERIANFALRAARAAQAGTAMPRPARPSPVGAELASEFVGRYGNRAFWVDLVARDGELWEIPSHGTPRTYGLAPLSDMLRSDGRFDPRWGAHTIRRVDGGIERDGKLLRRYPDRLPPKPIPPVAELIGEYGWDHDVLYVLEGWTTPSILIEWFAQYPLVIEDMSTLSFRMPPNRGMYHGERVRFERDDAGAIVAVHVGAVRFPRRDVGGAGAGETFKIQPRFPIERLRAMAAEARMPQSTEPDMLEPDLVDLELVDDSIQLDVRYASDNNFMGTAFYDEPRAMLQRPAAEALGRVAERLRPFGLGLLVYDGYRPWSVTKMFWDATPEDLRDFVANPANGSRHNRGCAVDLSLYDRRTGDVLEMVSGYDEFTPRAYPHYPGGSWRGRWARDLLRQQMEAEEFAVYEFEWWHFDYRDWQRYPILNLPVR